MYEELYNQSPKDEKFSKTLFDKTVKILKTYVNQAVFYISTSKRNIYINGE